ncbi:MAG TPA: hypothetical protein VF980_00400 [Thermoanaerobaculia bacterium]
MIELNAETLAVCASVLAGVDRGLFVGDDYGAIWDRLPYGSREYVLELMAVARDQQTNGFEENNS